MMDLLRQKIVESRVRNCDARYFVPDSIIERLFNEESIANCVRESEIALHKRRECVHATRHGGRKVFAILILIGTTDRIVDFLENDQLLKEGSLDSRLPFSVDGLMKILSDRRWAKEFYEWQWQLLAPFFKEDTIHRVFDADTVLPFIESEELGRGGFGRVFEVLLPGTHHGFTFQPQKLASHILCRYDC